MCKDSSKRPVGRLLRDSRGDIRMSWARVVTMRNDWVLTVFWEAESTELLDRLDGRCQRKGSPRGLFRTRAARGIELLFTDGKGCGWIQLEWKVRNSILDLLIWGFTVIFPSGKVKEAAGYIGLGFRRKVQTRDEI